MPEPIQQFAVLSRFRCDDGWSIDHGVAWTDKRDQVSLHLQDLPVLERLYRERRVTLLKDKPNARFEDPIPALRLANACEASASALYSLAEVAARFAATATRRTAQPLPGNFNTLLKRRVECAEADNELRTALGDVTWYRRVRELRTEWTHHSSVFIGGGEQGEPVFVVKGFRDAEDRKVLGERTVCTVAELCTWIREAVRTTDRFAGYLVTKFIAPKLRGIRDVTFMDLDRGPKGELILGPTGVPLAKRTSVADLLRSVGIDPGA